MEQAKRASHTQHLMTLYVFGLQEVGAADAQSELDIFCEVLEQVCKTTSDDGTTKFNKVFASIKNLMCDH